MKALIGLLCGMIFGAGLAVSGMTDTAKVLGFLDLFGDWVPDLAFVMGGAVLVTLIYLAIQIRQSARSIEDNEKLAMSQAYQARTDMWIQVTGLVDQ